MQHTVLLKHKHSYLIAEYLAFGAKMVEYNSGVLSYNFSLPVDEVEMRNWFRNCLKIKAKETKRPISQKIDQET